MKGQKTKQSQDGGNAKKRSKLKRSHEQQLIEELQRVIAEKNQVIAEKDQVINFVDHFDLLFT